ncbi:MAG: hypothetical protein QOJ37_228 [Pseudonocardiales bacterium]|nr:hypothetical protein [Pseudonocardiales bacterium]
MPTRTRIIALVTVLCTLVVVLVLTFENSSAAATSPSAAPLRHSQGQARGSAAKTKETARPTAKVQTHFYIGGLGLTVVLPDVPTAAPKPKPKATAAAHPQRKVGLPPRTKPGWVTDGHYLRSLLGTPRDLAAMRGLGARDATRNPPGQKHMVLLDIGGQARNGVQLSATTKTISYAALTTALTAYADGYHSAQRSNAPVTIALGTNNDLEVSAWTGRRWAQMVTRVQQHAKHYPQITIAGADDVEPGFSGGPVQSRNWTRAYLANTSAPLVFNGSADGCSPSSTFSGCNNGWTARDLAWFGIVAPSRVDFLPQIYNPTMAEQWAQISSTAVRSGRRALNFVGPLTESQACHGAPACPTMPSGSAWSALWRTLTGVRLQPRTLPVQIDLNVK